MPRYSPIANFFSILTTWWDDLLVTGPIPAPHITRFVVRSDELLNSKYGRSDIGAERPILIPSILLYLAWRIVPISHTLKHLNGNDSKSYYTSTRYIPGSIIYSGVFHSSFLATGKKARTSFILFYCHVWCLKRLERRMYLNQSSSVGRAQDF